MFVAFGPDSSVLSIVSLCEVVCVTGIVAADVGVCNRFGFDFADGCCV